MFRERTRSILHAIDEAERLSGDASKRLAEVEKRWSQLDSQIAAMKAFSEAQMENEVKAWAAQAAEETRRILEYSQFEIGRVAERVRLELKAFAAKQAVPLARQLIRVDEKTDLELVKRVVEGLQYTDETASRALEASPPAIGT